MGIDLPSYFSHLHRLFRLPVAALFLVWALFVSAPAGNASVFTRASCSVVYGLGNGATAIGSSSCSVGIPGESSAEATSQFAANYGADGVNTFVISQNLAVQARQTSNGFESAGAASLINGSIPLQTQGTPRYGFVLMSFSPVINGVTFVKPDIAQGTLDVRLDGVPGVDSPGLAFSCSFYFDYPCQSGGTFGAINKLVPVILGYGFSAYILSAPSVDSYPGEPAVSGSISGVFTFRFLESDGITPVAVIPTPEPSSLTLAGFAVAVLAIPSRLRKRRNSQLQ